MALVSTAVVVAGMLPTISKELNDLSANFLQSSLSKSVEIKKCGASKQISTSLCVHYSKITHV